MIAMEEAMIKYTYVYTHVNEFSISKQMVKPLLKERQIPQHSAAKKLTTIYSTTT